MKEYINILSIDRDVTDTWSRRFRFEYKRGAVVEADLSWGGEHFGYSIYIEEIECHYEDPSAVREIEQSVHAWAEGMTQHDLYELDEQTEGVRIASLS